MWNSNSQKRNQALNRRDALQLLATAKTQCRSWQWLRLHYSLRAPANLRYWLQPIDLRVRKYFFEHLLRGTQQYPKHVFLFPLYALLHRQRIACPLPHVLHIAKHAHGFLHCEPSVTAHDHESILEVPMVRGIDRRSASPESAAAADATPRSPQHGY